MSFFRRVCSATRSPHALTLCCVSQTRVAGEADVFRERAELHDPSQSASLLVSQ